MERKLRSVNISDKVIKYPKYAGLKVANSYTEILKGQYHQPQLHFHGELLKRAVLETLEHSSA